MSYVYINFGKELDTDLISSALKKYFWYEKVINILPDYAIVSFDTSDGGTIISFARHISMQDDDWVLSASYNLLKKLGCEDSGYVILSEILDSVDDKVTVTDTVFRFGTELLLNSEVADSISLRNDVTVVDKSNLTIEDVEYTKLTLDKAILVQVTGSEVDDYIKRFKEILK